MMRFLTAAFVVLICVASASADYVLIKIDLNKLNFFPANGPGIGGQPGGPFPGGAGGGEPFPGGAGGGQPFPGGVGGGQPFPGGVGGGQPGGVAGGQPLPGGASGQPYPAGFMGMQPPSQMNGGFAGFAGFQGQFPQPPDPNQPNGGIPMPTGDDPNAKWISAVVEVKDISKMPSMIPGVGLIYGYQHRWSAKYNLLPYSPLYPWVSLPVKAEPFEPAFVKRFVKEKNDAKSAKDKNQAVDNFLHLARWTLSRGQLKRFHDVMAEAEKLNAKHSAVVAYHKAKKALKQPLKDEDPAQAEFLQDLVKRGYSATVSKKSAYYNGGHFAIYTDAEANGNDKATEAIIARRLAMMEETLETFYYWFAVQKENSMQPRFPKYRLNSLLAGADEYKIRRADWGSPPAVGDGFTPRRDNLFVMAAKVRMEDPLYQEFDQLLNTKIQDANNLLEKYRIFITREDLLSGKILENKSAGQVAIFLAAAQTAALLHKTLEDDAERYTVTHESVRQLLIASEMFPRNVQIPDWVMEGLASLFETPAGSLYPTVGAPSWKHSVSFKHLRKTRLPDSKAKEALFNVVTDGYFNQARSASADLADQPSDTDLKNQAREAWELARATAWSFTYFLAQKGELGYLFSYGKELDRLPRDLDLSDQVLQSSFGKAFNLADPRDATRLDEIKMQNKAEKWFGMMQSVAFAPGEVLAYYVQQRAAEDTSSSSGTVVSNPKSGTKTPSGWVQFTSAEGRYSVNMPSAPNQKVLDLPGPVGNLRMTVYEVEQNGRMFGVLYCDLPEGPNYGEEATAHKLLDAMLDGAAKTNKGTVKSSSKIKLGGHHGREALVESKDEGTAKLRMFIAGNRIYITVAAWEPAKGGTGADSAKFLDSFRILAGGAAAGAGGAGGGAGNETNSNPNETNSNPMPANPNPPPNQPPKAGLTGSTWSGTESLAGYGALTFRFGPGGQAIMVDKDGNTRGKWTQEGDNVTLTFPGGVTYTGTVTGDKMQGNATNGKDNWDWTISRAGGGANPGGVNPSPSVEPMPPGGRPPGGRPPGRPPKKG